MFTQEWQESAKMIKGDQISLKIGKMIMVEGNIGCHSFFRWTTYLKSRLNCSIPGDYPFYFNHLRKNYLENGDIVVKL